MHVPTLSRSLSTCATLRISLACLANMCGVLHFSASARRRRRSLCKLYDLCTRYYLPRSCSGGLGYQLAIVVFLHCIGRKRDKGHLHKQTLCTWRWNRWSNTGLRMSSVMSMIVQSRRGAGGLKRPKRSDMMMMITECCVYFCVGSFYILAAFHIFFSLLERSSVLTAIPSICFT